MGKFSVLLVFVLGLNFAGARVWTSKKGKTLDAELVRVKEKQVTLRLKNNKTRVIAYDFFSQEDQLYLKNLDAKGSAMSEGNSGWTNWGNAWPKLVSTSATDFEITELDTYNEDDQATYSYESDNFLFESDVQLTKSLVKKFAWYFESTLKYIEVLPLSMARTQETKKHKVVLFEKREDYFANGGPVGSAGVYIGGKKDLVMVPLSGLGVKKSGSRYTVDFDGSNKTLSHEVVHSFTDRVYFAPGSRGWFTEGIAEYISITPYRGGKYITNKSKTALIDYVTGYGRKNQGGRALGDEIQVGSLEEFMLLPYEDFLLNASHNYGVAALMVGYFCDLARDKELENLQNFLKALKEKKESGDALEALLNGRSFEQLEQDIAKAWRGKQVKLKFN